VEAVKVTFKKYETAFYGLNGSKAGQRWGNCYCKNSANWGSDNLDRYRSLNLTNFYGGWADKKTVEIRVWAGTLDIAKVIMAVYMAVALVAKAATEGADAGARIENPVDAARAFCTAHYNNEQYRICPDCTVNEITRPLVAECRKARLA
jgi:hypothetical protein